MRRRLLRIRKAKTRRRVAQDAAHIEEDNETIQKFNPVKGGISPIRRRRSIVTSFYSDALVNVLFHRRLSFGANTK